MVGPLAGRGGRRSLAEFERRPGCGRLARQRRWRFAHERRARRRGSERARRAGRVRIGVGIECVRPPRPWRDARLGRGQGRFGNVRLRRSALGAIAEAVFHVLAELLQLRLEPALGVLQFLDPAVRLAKLFLKPVDAHHEPGGVADPRRPGCRRAGEPDGGRYRTALEQAPQSRDRRPDAAMRLGRNDDVTGSILIAFA